MNDKRKTGRPLLLKLGDLLFVLHKLHLLLPHTKLSIVQLLGPPQLDQTPISTSKNQNRRKEKRGM